MQKIALLFSVVVLTCAASCNCGFDGCACVDCEGNDEFIVQFLSKTDSTDLLASGAIPADSLQIFAVKEGKNEPFNWLELKAALGKGPFLPIGPGVSAYIFQIGVQERDTLLVQSHPTARGKCCGGNTVLDVALYKGDTIQPFQTIQGPVLRLFQ